MQFLSIEMQDKMKQIGAPNDPYSPRDMKRLRQIQARALLSHGLSGLL